MSEIVSISMQKTMSWFLNEIPFWEGLSTRKVNITYKNNKSNNKNIIEKNWWQCFIMPGNIVILSWWPFLFFWQENVPCNELIHNALCYLLLSLHHYVMMRLVIRMVFYNINMSPLEFRTGLYIYDRP